MQKLFLNYFGIFTFLTFNNLNPAYAMEVKEELWDIHSKAAVQEYPQDYGTVHIYPQDGAYDQHKGNSKLHASIQPTVKAPLIQNYNLKKHGSIPVTVPFFMHVPNKYTYKLNEAIRQEIEKDSVKSESVKIFVVGQNCPYDIEGENEHKGLYPQYATDPQVPEVGDYFAIRYLKMMVCYSDAQNVKFYNVERKESPENLEIKNDGNAISTVLNKTSVIHPACISEPDKHCTHEKVNECQVVASPQPIGLTGLRADFGQSFWSYISYHDGYDNRAIVTLHMLFDDKQLDSIEDLNDLNLNIGEDGNGVIKTSDLVKMANTAKKLPGFKDKGGHWQKFLSLIE